MRTRSTLFSLALVVGLPCSGAMAVNFGQITTFDPLSDPVNATVGVDLNNTQTFVLNHNKDVFDNQYPKIHWFKYVSDGQTAVTFDTFGTNVSSVGPDPDRSFGNFITFVNQTQLALYDSSGNLVGNIGATKDIDGELVPEFPGAGYDPGDPNHHLSNSAVGLSELIFMQNPPDNPHWDTSPGGISDPNSTVRYEGLHINDCPSTVCSGQKYGDADPLSPNFWNEYRVHDETLDGVVNETLAGWRASDHYNVGPNASWNRYNILPAGEYYLVITGVGPSFSGDTAKEEYLMAPFHDGWDNSDPFNPVFIQNVPRIDAPMGPFQMYVGDVGSNDNSQWGTIQLNITHFSLALEGDLNGDGFVGIADLNIVLGAWNQNVAPGDLLQGDPSGDGFVGIADLNVVLGNWNAGTPPASDAAIPEPGTLALLGLGGAALVRRR